MNILANIVLCIFFWVDGPVDKILERKRKLAFTEGNGEVESVGFFLKHQLIANYLHWTYFNILDSQKYFEFVAIKFTNTFKLLNPKIIKNYW